MSKSQKNEDEKHASVCFKCPTDNFVKCISSLDSTLDASLDNITKLCSKNVDEFRVFEKENVKHSETLPEGTALIRISEREKYEQIMDARDSINIAFHLVPQSFLVSMVSQFDAYLGSIIRNLLLLFPGWLDSDQKAFSYSDAFRFDSIEAAREFAIEKEVERILRKSHSDHFDYLENKLGISLRKDLESWPRFIELTERRHLFVHCDAKVSSQYIEACTKNKVKFERQIKRGEHLGANSDYVKDAFDIVFEIGVKLGHVIWRKVLPDEREIADQNLLQIVFELLKTNKIALAVNLSTFACETLKKYYSEEMRRMFIVNRALAFIKVNDTKTAKEIVEKEDWSAVGYNFRLAEAILKQDYAVAGETMLKIGYNSEIVPNTAYYSWPLFHDFQKSPEFLSAFKKISGFDFLNGDTDEAGFFLDRFKLNASCVKKNRKSCTKIETSSSASANANIPET
jgi:hypothetical protein